MTQMNHQKIPPIIVINLLRDVDKKRYISKILESLNLPYEFFEAVDGKQLSNAEINKVYDSKAAKKIRGTDLLMGEIGCSLSHLGVYQKMLSEGIEKAIILEDDAILEDGFLQVISAIEHFPSDWELVLLGYNYKAIHCKIKQTQINTLPGYHLYQSLFKAWCAHGYVINQKGAQKILTANQKIYRPIDYYTGNYKIVNYYVVHPKVVNVDSGIPSSINNEVIKKKHENSFLMALRAINKKRKNAKWLREIECSIRKIMHKK